MLICLDKIIVKNASFIKTWQEVTVKSYEESQTVSSWQASKLACSNYIEDSRRLETPELDMKDRNSIGQSSSNFPLFLRSPVPTGWDKKG